MDPRTRRRLLGALWMVPVFVLLVPLGVLLWLALMLADVLGRLLPRRRLDTSRVPDDRAFSVVVVTWNGKDHLEKLLPTLAAEAERDGDATGGEHQLVVVDNGSTDGTAAWLAEHWPQVDVVALPANRYFGGGNRAGVPHTRHDLLLFLNNDMQVQPGLFQALRAGFRTAAGEFDRSVFAVTAEVFFADPEKRREETGLTRVAAGPTGFKPRHDIPTEKEQALPAVPCFWPGGGSSAVRKDLFQALGMFDPLYDPFYVEDLALGHAAWRRGLRNLFTARGSVVHAHRGTSRRAFGDDFVDRMIRRNLLRFAWAQVTDFRWTCANSLGLPVAVFGRASEPHVGPPGKMLAAAWRETVVILRAIRALPLALVRRVAMRRDAVVSDRQIVDQVGG